MATDPIDLKTYRQLKASPLVWSRDEVIKFTQDLGKQLEQCRNNNAQLIEYLSEAQKIAHQAIEAINHGATVDELRDRFRDIATAARRR